MTHTGEGVFNLGTGHGYSVLDMVHAFEEANGVKVPYEITARRPGGVLNQFQAYSSNGCFCGSGAVPDSFITFSANSCMVSAVIQRFTPLMVIY